MIIIVVYQILFFSSNTEEIHKEIIIIWSLVLIRNCKLICSMFEFGYLFRILW